MKVGLLVKLLFDHNIWTADKYENSVLKKKKYLNSNQELLLKL